MAAAEDNTVDMKDSLEYQTTLIEAMMETFEAYLVPSEIFDRIPLDESFKEELTVLEENGKIKKAAKKLIKVIQKDPAQYVSPFIAELRRIGFQRFISILDDDPENKETSQAAEKYDLLLKMLKGELIERIIPSEIIDSLIPILNTGDSEEILAIEDRRGPIQACRHLFRCMQRKTSTWPLKFLDALCQNERRLAEKIDPALAHRAVPGTSDTGPDDGDDDNGDDDDMYSMNEAESMMSTDAAESLQTEPKDVYVPDVEMTEEPSMSFMSREQRLLQLENQVESSSERQSASVNFSDDEKQDDENTEKEEIYNREAGTPDLKLRDYQLELAENAVQGRNTIICAPTGSGKTRVALYIVKEHLDKGEKGKQKVVFLARTVPLVNQQYTAFQKFLGNDYNIFKLSGEDEHSMYLHQFLNMYDIIVMTPQILENQLKDTKIKTVSVFTLVVLDECHHTRKGEPYNHLMLRYLKEKKKGVKNLPQIVGLTASLGVEKATVDEEAVNNILKLCANMDAPYLSTVEHYIDELRAKVPVPDEKSVQLTENRQDPARKELEKVMGKIEDLMIDVNELHDKAIDNLLMKCPSDRNSQPYGQWAVQMKNESRLVQTGRRDGVFGVEVDPKRAEMARSLFVMADHLFRYNAALEIHDIVRIKDVIDYLEKEFSHICFQSHLPSGTTVHVPCEDKLEELFNALKKMLMRFERKRQTDPSHDNPNLKVLATTLKGLLNEKGDDSRAIIFVRTRATCYALCNWLNEDEQLDQQLKDMKAMPFTGAGAHEEEGGMTQNEQDKVISKFKNGQIKLVVATSVAEEGLDIPECNIVLKYNHVGNEITTLQTRGRSRKAGGTSVLLGNSKIQQKEMMNVARASMMQRAITSIKTMPHDRVLRRIQDHQAESLEREAIKEEVKRHQTNRKSNDDFSLMCACCRKFCTFGKNMRIINGNQHVVVDKEFKDRIHVQPFKNQKKPFDGITMTGGMHCKGCHKPWGVMFIYQGVSFPSLGLKYFIVINQRTHQPQYYKKWLEMPYNIKDISSDDFKTYLGTSDGASSEEDEFDLC